MSTSTDFTIFGVLMTSYHNMTIMHYCIMYFVNNYDVFVSISDLSKRKQLLLPLISMWFNIFQPNLGTHVELLLKDQFYKLNPPPPQKKQLCKPPVLQIPLFVSHSTNRLK